MPEKVWCCAHEHLGCGETFDCEAELRGLGMGLAAQSQGFRYFGV